MKTVKPSNNAHQWPRKAVNSIECRKRDLIVRIADWTRTKEEPAFDVEVYIGGVYDWNQSRTFTLNALGSKERAKEAAVKFASERMAESL